MFYHHNITLIVTDIYSSTPTVFVSITTNFWLDEVPFVFFSQTPAMKALLKALNFKIEQRSPLVMDVFAEEMEFLILCE